MGTILVYDWDFFHYPSVIPNLECAKYAAYQKQNKEIIVFNNNLDPSKYTKVFFRKEYDDGNYTNLILNPNVEYGGRAFSSTYKPFNLEMESIIPDFSIYEKYRSLYGTQKHKQEEMQTILNATHVRLSLDEKTLQPFPYERLRPRHPSIIFHDYDIAKVPGAFELLLETSKLRPSGLSYRIGNKYPINVYTFNELQKWLQLPPMGTCFYLQYNGIFTEEEIIELVEKPTLGLRQMLYNFTFDCSDEDDFINRVLPQIYKQILFLRSHKIKILLNIDNNFFKTRELLNLMKLINCYYGRSKTTYIHPYAHTLYGFCAWKRRAALEVLPWVHFIVSREEMRESFQYMRQKNYEVFDMFYSIPSVIAKGGKLINEWNRDSI